MDFDKNNNNKVRLFGEIVSHFRYSHETFGEKFYIVDIAVERLSGADDTIHLTVSEHLIDVKKNWIGEFAIVCGQFRSYNEHKEEKSKLFLSVFVRELEFVDEDSEVAENNQIYLEGFICKEPIYRKTPLGREIADLLIAVNRPYGKSDYIPCIAWGRNARFAATLQIGEKIHAHGRIQSREYVKNKDTVPESMIAYEVSLNSLEKE